MAGVTSYQGHSGSPNAVAASVNQFLEPGNGGTGVSASPNEAQRQLVWQDAGMMTNFYIKITANATTGGTSQLNNRIGGAGGNLSITITMGTPGEYFDTSHTDSVVATNLVDQQQLGGTGGTWTWGAQGYLFIPSTSGNTVTMCMSDGLNSGYVPTTTYYNNYQSVNNANTTESAAQYKCQAAATLQNFSTNIRTFTGSPTVTLYSRIGGSNGNQSITPTSASNFADTTHTDSITAGNLINYSIVITAGSAFGTSFVEIDWVSTNNNAYYSTASPADITFAANTTTYLQPLNRLNTGTPETNVSCQTQTAFTASLFQTSIAANSITGNTVFTFRIGGSSGNGTVTVGSSALGWFQDTAHADSVATTSEINYMIVAPNSGTSIEPNVIGFLATLSAIGYTLTGPTSGASGSASTNFTLTPASPIASDTISFSDGGAGGTFTPSSLTFTDSGVAQTFTYTPAEAGTITLTLTSGDGGAISGSPATYTSTTTYTLTGPSTGAAGTASTNFTVTPAATIVSDSITFSDGGAGGTFSPSSLTFTNSSAAQTFTYTPVTTGAISLTLTSGNSYTVTNSPKTYTVHTTYTLTGPTSGAGGVPSTNFTLTPAATVASDTISFSDGGAGGTFTPSSLTFTATGAAKTFTYTPAAMASGAITLTITSGDSYTVSGSPKTYTISTATTAGSAILFTM